MTGALLGGLDLEPGKGARLDCQDTLVNFVMRVHNYKYSCFNLHKNYHEKSCYLAMASRGRLAGHWLVTAPVENDQCIVQSFLLLVCFILVIN
jgi:hypothetical protein